MITVPTLQDGDVAYASAGALRIFDNGSARLQHNTFLQTERRQSSGLIIRKVSTHAEPLVTLVGDIRFTPLPVMYQNDADHPVLLTNTPILNKRVIDVVEGEKVYLPD